MKIVVFGGTGDVGKVIVDKLIAKNEEVAVLTRQFKQSTGKLHYITGNVLDYESVEKCVSKGDKVIISLGFNNSEHDTMSRGTKNILDAMKRNNCNRLICLSAQGAGDSWNYMPNEFKEMVMNDSILKASFHDHGIQEELITSSNFEWTIVRPTEIIEKQETGTFSVNFPTEHSFFQISKYDVAQFIADELLAGKYLRQAVMITD